MIRLCVVCCFMGIIFLSSCLFLFLFLLNASISLFFCLIFLFLSLTPVIMSDDFEENNETPDDSEDEILANGCEYDILASQGIHSDSEIHLEDLKRILTQYASDRNFQVTHSHH